MDPIWVVIAFLVGLAVKQFGLPPMVGFLGAGFVLSSIGVENSDILRYLADLGIYLLLFSIGLKLDLRGLAKPEVWGVASVHKLLTTALVGGGVFGLSALGLGMFSELSWKTSLLVAFALSFSSTVFAVKVLEEKAEMKSRHGHQAIGVLIVQDIFAIVFLTVSMGKMPSPWAVGLLLLPLARPLLRIVIDRVGHGELLLLAGLVMVYGFTTLFEFVQMKPDLGALIAGLLIASHPKASEMAKSLLSLKDLLLVAFFLTIGLNGLPGLEQLGIAVALVALVPLKARAFFWLMTKFRLRSRTATLSSLALANASEFGLIVGALGVPLFSEGESGLVTILGQTGGYLIGFAACQPVIGWIVRRRDGSVRGWGAMMVAVLAGHGVIFLIGVPWLYAVRRLDGDALTVGQAIQGGFVVFIPAMLLKSGIAVIIGRWAAPMAAKKIW